MSGYSFKYPQTKGDPFSKRYGEHFVSKAGILFTELPSNIVDTISNDAWQTTLV